MEILPQIHKVERTRGSNVYLLVDQTLTLIDTGLPGNGEGILSYIRNMGRHPEELTRIIITHSHPDHTGSVPSLRRLTQARILAHRADAEALPGKENKFVLTLRVTRQTKSKIARILRQIPPFSPAPVDQFLEDGDVIPCLDGVQVIHAPGHTPGSICLYLPARKTIFSGDLVVSKREIPHRPIPHPAANLEQYEESLRKLVELDLEICCCGHGRPLTDASGKLRQLLAQPPTVSLFWRVLRSMPL